MSDRKRVAGLAALLTLCVHPAAVLPAPSRPEPGELPRPRCLWRMNGVTVARHGLAASLGPKAGTILLQREPARDTVVVDIRTGRIVGKPDPGPLHPAPNDFLSMEGSRRRETPVRDGGLLWIITEDRVEARRTRGGHVEKAQPLPAFLIGRSEVDLFVSQGRITIVSPANRVTTDGLIATTKADAPAWSVLERPAIAMEVELAGDVLLTACSFDRTVAAFSLTDVEPPLAKLPAEAAVAAAKSDSGKENRLLFDHLIDLPQLGPFWLDQLRRPKGELHDSAIRVMAYRPVPEALPLLLAESALVKPGPRWNRRDDGLAFALGSQDAQAAAKRLLELAKAADGLPAVRRRGVNVFREEAHRALWRTGRAGDFGLCTDAREHPVPALSKSSPDGSIGTPDPFIFESVAADGSWTVLCQAREDTDGDGVITANLGHHGDVFGDRMRPFLIVGSGPGLPVDEFIAAGARGRFVALRDGPCLSLVDTQRRSVVTLPNADLRDDDGVFGSHRATAFDARGERLLYLRGTSAGERLVVRTLATGREIELDPGPGLLWRAALDPAGRWVMAEIATGRDWPRLMTTLAGRSCRGAAMSYSVFGPANAPPIIRRWAPAGGGRMQEVAGLIRPVAGGLLVREETGALAIVAADGKRKPIAAADCHGKLADAEPSGDGLLVVCSSPRDEQGRLMLFAGGRSSFITTTPIPAHDTWTGAGDGVLTWNGSWIDTARRAFVSEPASRQNDVRETSSWDERKKGLFAIRGDKKLELRRQSPATNSSYVPDGPLKWVPAGASH